MTQPYHWHGTWPGSFPKQRLVSDGPMREGVVASNLALLDVVIRACSKSGLSEPPMSLGEKRHTALLRVVA
jgi:hypothetical protein